jgi:hypothetical protein
MNFWQFAWNVFCAIGSGWKAVANFLWNNKLKVLSAVQLAVAVVSSTTGLIPAAHLPVWMAANAILCGWIGMAHNDDPKVDITKPKSISPETPK